MYKRQVITYVRTLPVHVRITNSDADMSGVVTVDVNRNEQEYDRYELPLSVASGSTLEASLPVVLTQMQKSYTVRWVVDGETVVQREIEPGGTIDPSLSLIHISYRRVDRFPHRPARAEGYGGAGARPGRAAGRGDRFIKKQQDAAGCVNLPPRLAVRRTAQPTT